VYQFKVINSFSTVFFTHGFELLATFLGNHNFSFRRIKTTLYRLLLDSSCTTLTLQHPWIAGPVELHLLTRSLLYEVGVAARSRELDTLVVLPRTRQIIGKLLQKNIHDKSTFWLTFLLLSFGKT